MFPVSFDSEAIDQSRSNTFYEIPLKWMLHCIIRLCIFRLMCNSLPVWPLKNIGVNEETAALLSKQKIQKDNWFYSVRIILIDIFESARKNLSLNHFIFQKWYLESMTSVHSTAKRQLVRKNPIIESGPLQCTLQKVFIVVKDYTIQPCSSIGSLKKHGH